MIKYVIDFQGFSHNRSYILKELTITDLDAQNVLHFMAKPPFDKDILSDVEKNNVLWLENHHHKIKWEDGVFEYSEVFANLREAIRNADILFVKGGEKCQFIRQVTGKTTIDLNDLDCPRACALPTPLLWSTLCCSYYAHSSLETPCSLLQALKFNEWLNTLFQQNIVRDDL